MTEELFLALAVSLAGGLGATTRHAVDALMRRSRAGESRATFVVNVSGSFALGLTVGLAGRQPWMNGTALDVLGIGFLGGYTTFSTAMLQAVQGVGEPGAVAGDARAGFVRAGMRGAWMLLPCVAAAALGMLAAGLVGGGR